MKIAVIGYSGSGKSTLAEFLGKKFGVEVLHLDRVHWLPGWIENRVEDEVPIVEAFMDSNSSWIIDGNYSRTLFKRRMEEADRILFLDFNRVACLFRVVKRFLKYRGTSRGSMAEGCPDKMDLEFIWWIVHAGRTEKHKERYRGVLRDYGDKTVVIRNQRQLTGYMEQTDKNERV